jgi:ribosomal protein S18 acetylase RimI-like enzyme
MKQEVRIAQKGDLSRLKEIWQLCFGDPVSYIDFFFSNRFKSDKTAVLLHDNEIAAMLTMIPVRTVTPENQIFNTAMLYAIATDPKHQKRGFAAQLIDFSGQYLSISQAYLSVLVPAKAQLFDYYSQQGYRNGFYIKETLFFSDSIANLPILEKGDCIIKSIAPQEYNRRRNNQLTGRLYISYQDEDISYQKNLSQLSGADIYAVDIDNMEGCLAVERVSSDKVLIKEILLPEDFLNLAIKQIRERLPAKEYILRTPPYLAEHLEGTVRPFGMIKAHKDLDWIATPNDLGYLGFAFD